MKKYFSSLLFFILTVSCTAQRTEQLYDYQWQPVAADYAQFFTITQQWAELFHRRNYYIREDQLQMEGFYKDRKCKIKQGYFNFYYPGSKPRVKCRYDNDQLTGRYLSFYENGNLEIFTNYDKGKIIGRYYSLHPNGMLMDSMIINKDGSGSSVSWHMNGKPAAAGYFAKGGKQDGNWQYFHANGKHSSKELYVAGRLIDKTYFDTTGNQEKDTANTDRQAGFPGGDTAWIKYLSPYAKIPPGWEQLPSGSVVVEVSAVVDEAGKLTDAFVSVPFHPAFDKIALNLVTASPQWLPAIEHHRKMKAKVRLPVRFLRMN